MNLFNRAAMVIVAALMLLTGAFVLSQAYGWPPLTAFQDYLWLVQLSTFLLEQPAGVVSSSGLATAFLGLILMFFELRAPGGPTAQIIVADQLGEVTVSLAGLKRLAEHVIRAIPGVETVRAETTRRRTNVDFRCQLVLKPDSSAPDVGQQVREQLSATVLHHTGIEPGRIHIHTQVGTAPSARRKRVS